MLSKPTKVMSIGGKSSLALRGFDLAKVALDCDFNRNDCLAGRVVQRLFWRFDRAREDARLELPRIEGLTRGCADGAGLSLTVFPPLEVKGSALGALRLSVDEDEFRPGSAVHPYHRDKLPFAVDRAILFEVGLAASRFTIHLLSTPPSLMGLGCWAARKQFRFALVLNKNYTELDSKLDSKIKLIA